MTLFVNHVMQISLSIVIDAKLKLLRKLEACLKIFIGILK